MCSFADPPLNSYANNCWLGSLFKVKSPASSPIEAQNPFWFRVGSEKALEQPDGALLPRHAVRDAGGLLEPLAVLDIPPEVPQECLLVRVLRRETEFSFGLLYRDEGILGGGLVDPFVARREVKLVQDSQTPDRRCSREADDPFAVPGEVEDSLVVLLHRGELFGADVEGVVDLLLRKRQAQGDGVAEVFDVEELVAVVAATDHGEVVSSVGPVVEQCEHPEAFGADERLGPDDRDHEALRAILQADHLRLYLGLPVWTYTLEPVGLVERVVVRSEEHTSELQSRQYLVCRL